MWVTRSTNTMKPLVRIGAAVGLRSSEEKVGSTRDAVFPHFLVLFFLLRETIGTFSAKVCSPVLPVTHLAINKFSHVPLQEQFCLRDHRRNQWEMSVNLGFTLTPTILNSTTYHSRHCSLDRYCQVGDPVVHVMYRVSSRLTKGVHDFRGRVHYEIELLPFMFNVIGSG